MGVGGFTIDCGGAAEGDSATGAPIFGGAMPPPPPLSRLYASGADLGGTILSAAGGCKGDGGLPIGDGLACEPLMSATCSVARQIRET